MGANGSEARRKEGRVTQDGYQGSQGVVNESLRTGRLRKEQRLQRAGEMTRCANKVGNVGLSERAIEALIGGAVKHVDMMLKRRGVHGRRTLCERGGEFE